VRALDPPPREGRNLEALESTLVERARRGEREALGQIYRIYSAKVMVVALSLTRSRDDAEDIVHDVFLSLPRRLKSYSGSGTLEGWLKAVAARRALDFLRRGRTRGECQLSHHLAEGRGVEDQTIADIDMLRALDQLPDTLRAIFIFREILGYTHDEIGERLDIEAGTSAVHLHRAKKKLQKLLER